MFHTAQPEGMHSVRPKHVKLPNQATLQTALSEQSWGIRMRSHHLFRRECDTYLPSRHFEAGINHGLKTLY